MNFNSAIVTGSHGFIGRNLVDRLRSNGVEVFEFDLKNGKNVSLVKKWPEVDVFFHLACVNQMEAVDHPARNRFVNSVLTGHCADAAKKMGAKFVYTSTASVYGNAEVIPTPVTAKTLPLSEYAKAKLKGEYTARAFGDNPCILRLSNVYGPGQTLENPYCGVIGRFIENSLTGRPLQVIGQGTQTRDFTFVDDVVNSLLDAIPGTYNVSYGKETSIYILARKIWGQTMSMGDYFHPEYASERPIDGIERRCLVSDFDCPTTLEEGLKKTIAWFDSRSATILA